MKEQHMLNFSKFIDLEKKGTNVTLSTYVKFIANMCK